jgi:hypothetical protein
MWCESVRCIHLGGSCESVRCIHVGGSCESVRCIHLGGSCESSNEPSSFIDGGEYLK